MTETLFRKSWQPLAEADKSSEQLVRHCKESRRVCSFVAKYNYPNGPWMAVPTNVAMTMHEYEFLCLEPVEVETDDFPKVI